MTLGEGKQKVYMLLDEHSAGGEVEHDPDIEAKMAFFFDMAQKEVARIAPILRTKRYTLSPGRTEYRLPEDCMDVRSLWKDGRRVACRVRAGKLLPGEGGELLLEYSAIPAAIGADTPDDYEFELREDGCNALPYYVAAQQLLPDLVMDYSGMLQMYQMALRTLSPEPPGEGARMEQRLFRR